MEAVIVRPDQILALALYHNTKAKRDSISFSKVYDYGEKLQNICNKEQLNIRIEDHDFMKCIEQGDSLFDYLESSGNMYARRKAGVTAELLLDKCKELPNKFLYVAKNNSL